MENNNERIKYTIITIKILSESENKNKLYNIRILENN